MIVRIIFIFRWSVVGYATADNYDLVNLADKLEMQGVYQVYTLFSHKDYKTYLLNLLISD